MYTKKWGFQLISAGLEILDSMAGSWIAQEKMTETVVTVRIYCGLPLRALLDFVPLTVHGENRLKDGGRRS